MTFQVINCNKTRLREKENKFSQDFFIQNAVATIFEQLYFEIFEKRGKLEKRVFFKNFSA